MESQSSFHNHIEAVSDHRRFSILYRLLSDIIRPKIETVVEHEHAAAHSTEEMRIALRIINGLVEDCVPGGRASLPKDDIRIAEAKIEELLLENKELVLQEELDSLSRNIARSVINAWITEIETSYDNGLILDARLTPVSLDTGFITEAMQPYHVPHFEDVVSQSMNSLGTLLVSRAKKDSWVGLPFGMRMCVKREAQYSTDSYIPLTYTIVHQSQNEKSRAISESNFDVSGVSVAASSRAQAINTSSLLGQIVFAYMSHIDNGVIVKFSEKSVHDKIYDMFVSSTAKFSDIPQSLDRDTYNKYIDIFGNTLRNTYSRGLHVSEHRKIHIADDDIVAVTDMNTESASNKDLLYGRVCFERAMDNAVLPWMKSSSPNIPVLQ